MSWSVGLIENSVTVKKATLKKLFDIQKYEDNDHGHIWWNLDDVSYELGKLNFDPDHMEHMDFLQGEHGEDFIEVLKEAKVKGEILFGSLEGDNDGDFWGYRFDGKGGMIHLTGNVEWNERT